MNASKWNPTAEPFRVTWQKQTRAAGLYGWTDVVRTFPTRDEAAEAMAAPFGAGIVAAVLDEAVNPETWTQDGSWKRLDSRKRRAARRA